MKRFANKVRSQITGRTAVLFAILFAVGLQAPSASGTAGESGEFESPGAPTASPIELPAPHGPYAVGTVTYHWLDDERHDLLDPRERHQLIVQLWYPADPATGDERAEYFPNLESFRLGLATLEGDRPARDAKRFAACERVVVPATKGSRVAREIEKLPVILFSPGGNMSRHFHTTLFAELASHGWLVAALSHKYSTWDIFPAGGFSLSRNWFTDDDPEGEALTESLAADATVALDRLTALSRSDSSGRFTNRIDLARIAIAGHSRGGKTVARACSADARFLACITLDNVGPAREVESGLSRPQMTIRTDDPDDWDVDRIALLRAFLERNPVLGREVVLKNATHNDFSDLPIVDPTGSPSRLDQTKSQWCIASAILQFLSTQLDTGAGAGIDPKATCPSIAVIDHGGPKER